MKNTLLALAALTAVLNLQGCATALVAGTAVTAVSAANDPRSLGVQIDDSTIEIKAMLDLMNDDGIDKHTHLNVVSYNGSILVVGQAPNQFLIDTALKILNSIEGVKKVHNRIKLGTPVTFSTKTTDTWITTKVKTNLLTDDVVKGHNIKVVTENKVVYLLGNVDQEQATAAAKIASTIIGVEQVITVFSQ